MNDFYFWFRIKELCSQGLIYIVLPPYFFPHPLSPAHLDSVFGYYVKACSTFLSRLKTHCALGSLPFPVVRFCQGPHPQGSCLISQFLRKTVIVPSCLHVLFSRSIWTSHHSPAELEPFRIWAKSHWEPPAPFALWSQTVLCGSYLSLLVFSS